MDWKMYFYYDEMSPSCLRWGDTRNNGVELGDVAGWINSSGRYCVKLNNKTYLVHRIIFEMLDRKLEYDEIIDHANRNYTDNRISNLRACSASKNAMNRKQIESLVKYKGVDLHKNKYRVRIKLEGKSKHIGYFDDPESAARAYDENALKYFGEFALLNFRQ